MSLVCAHYLHVGPLITIRVIPGGRRRSPRIEVHCHAGYNMGRAHRTVWKIVRVLNRHRVFRGQMFLEWGIEQAAPAKQTHFDLHIPGHRVGDPSRFAYNMDPELAKIMDDLYDHPEVPKVRVL